MEISRLLQQVQHGQADLVDFTKLLASYGRVQQWPKTLAALIALESAPYLSADTTVYNAAAAACAKSGGKSRLWAWALEILALPVRCRVQLDHVSSGVMMSALKRGSQISKASEFLGQLSRNSIQIGVQTYNILISALVDSARWPEALGQCAQLPANGLELDDFTRTTLLSSQREADAWRRGLELMKGGGAEAVRASIQMVGMASAWALGLICYRRCPGAGPLAALAVHRWQSALEELPKIPLQSRDFLALLKAPIPVEQLWWAQRAQGRVYGASLPVYGAVLGRCGEDRNWILSLDILDSMRSANVQPDCLCISSILDSTKTELQTGQTVGTAWRVALFVGEEFCEELQGTAQDQDLLGSVNLQALGVERWTLALQRLRHLRLATLRPQQLSFTSAAASAASGPSEWKQTLQTLQEAQDWAVDPNNSLLSCCASHWRVTWELLKSAARSQVQIYTSYFNACAGTFASASLWDEALDMMQRLSSRSLEPDGVSFRSLVKGAWEEALGFHSKSLDILEINALAQSTGPKHWQRCLEVLFQARSLGVEPDSVSRLLQLNAQSCSTSIEKWQLSMSIVANAEGNTNILYQVGISLSLS
ncbi:Pentatricopeptide repeat-containing protein At2g31400 [Durusdinium trenchii]|uniref:Chloroplastic n=1 Tax=Durusdinium trenchii TaxID=1381693 RepID=A0ABP0LGF2_9DINO